MTIFAPLDDIKLSFPDIYLYNTLTRNKERFHPINPQEVTFYSCGQTVYEKVHVGNAKTYLVWDLLVRTLEFFSYNVFHIQNFTDVGHLTDDADAGEDKIQIRASQESVHPMELVDREIREYWEDIRKLHIRPPRLSPRATAHITEMIDLVSGLLEKGHAYESKGSVYFDISTYPQYAELAKLNLDELQAGARVDLNPEKRHPLDFALWINAPSNHIMQYTSPWGRGYPGWHLECSVMALKYLGETIDIHAGGIDHIPVHHTNERAQSEAFTGKPFANFWLHSAFITVNGEKMSKSLNNFVTLREVVTKVHPAVARLSLMNMHYRTQGDYSWQEVEALETRYQRWIRSYHSALQITRTRSDLYMQDIVLKFAQSLADDLNVPLALNQIQEVMKLLNSPEDQQRGAALNTFELLLSTLGIPFPILGSEEISMVNDILVLRSKLREQKLYAEADGLRHFLQRKGYILEDKKGEIQWYRLTLE